MVKAIKERTNVEKQLIETFRERPNYEYLSDLTLKKWNEIGSFDL